MQRFFEFFREKNYGAFWLNLFNSFHLCHGIIAQLIALNVWKSNVLCHNSIQEVYKRKPF